MLRKELVNSLKFVPPDICSVAKKFHKTSDGGGSVEISITQLSLQLYKRIFEIYSGPLTSRFRNEFHE